LIGINDIFDVHDIEGGENDGSKTLVCTLQDPLALVKGFIRVVENDMHPGIYAWLPEDAVDDRVNISRAKSIAHKYQLQT
jgi:hypothetical protein